MKHWLYLMAMLLALGLGTHLHAQTDPTSFDVAIEAPDDVRPTLEQHLDLYRYRGLDDISAPELDRLMRQAEANARDLLATLGFFSPQVRVQRAAQTSDAARPTVQVQVTPGAPTVVSTVQIDFTGAVTAAEPDTDPRARILAQWSLATGRRFTQNDWDSAKQQALRLLAQERYATAQIASRQADIDPATQQAALHLTLDSGPAYNLGKVEVTGLQRYDALLVQRLARLQEGAPYSQRELVQAQQRLADSGFFDSAYVALDTASDPQAARVEIQLRETPLKKVVLGIGASTDRGPRLTLEHTHHRLPGLGWRAVSQVQLERDNRLIGTELTSPPDDDNWRWVASGLLQNQLLGTRDVTSEQLRGGRQQRQQRIDRNIYLQYDRAQSINSSTAETDVAQSLSANYAFTVRYYDQLPFPASGWAWAGEIGAGTTLGSQPQGYTRWLTRWQGFWRPTSGADAAATQTGRGRLSMRAALGAVVAREETALPSTQLFLAGGDNSVRGYALNTIGVTLPDGSLAGGRYLGTASIEWQQPLRIKGQLSAWEGVAFVDVGAVANRPEDLTPSTGVGVGARWNSPVGPLQIDLAYGLEVRRLRLHVTLGFTF